MITFDGEVAIITGAAQGQGAAEARMFAKLGARVLVADVDIERASAVAAEIGVNDALAVELDVSSEPAWLAALSAADRKFGRVDILVNNAGVYRPVPLLDAELADVQSVFDINQTGAYLGVRTVGRVMRTAGRGAIVNVASVAAIAPGEMSAIYGMTKAAVVNLTKGAALELGPTIRVNCVLPGAINTRMLSEGSAPFFRTIPLRRIGQPDEISSAVAFFASNASSYCTGATLVVDGGWTLGQSKENFRRLAE
jgi:3alpha(or 20beta)-hydroxysteroid dehydrogenase